MSQKHVWRVEAAEYDDTFYKCVLCGLRAHSRRGTPPETAAECRAESLPPCSSWPDLISTAARDAVELFGGQNDGVFNGACFSAAFCKLIGIIGPIDGVVVRGMLSGRPDIEMLSGGSHYKLKRPAVVDPLPYYFDRYNMTSDQKNALVLRAPLTAPFITHVLGLYRAGLINLSGSAAPIIQAYNEAQAEAVENGLELDEKALVQAVLGRFQDDVAVVAAPPPSRRSRAEVMEAARAPVTRPPDLPPSEPHGVSEPVDLTAHELEAWEKGQLPMGISTTGELIKMRRTLAWLVRQALLKGTR